MTAGVVYVEIIGVRSVVRSVGTLCGAVVCGAVVFSGISVYCVSSFSPIFCERI